jgi:hypothetical protein
MELSENDKIIAREIIEKGLQIEYGNNLKKVSAIIKDWEIQMNNRETQYKLYRRMIKFEKHISQRYEGVTGSKYLFVIAAQYVDEIIDKKDLERLSPEAQQAIEKIIAI